MDDQDWINLQQLVGRGPQPWSLPPEAPLHLSLADALDAFGLGSRTPGGPTPSDWADAIDAYGKPPAPDPGQSPQLSDEVDRTNSRDGSIVQPTLLSASIPAASPGAGAPPPIAADASAVAALTPASANLSLGPSGGAAATGAGTAYAMSSPANIDGPWTGRIAAEPTVGRRRLWCRCRGNLVDRRCNSNSRGS